MFYIISYIFNIKNILFTDYELLHDSVHSFPSLIWRGKQRVKQNRSVDIPQEAS